MEKSELEKLVKFDYWDEEDPDQDVFIYCHGRLRHDTKKNVLKSYLQKIQEKLVHYEAEEEIPRKLKLYYELQLEKANILATGIKKLEQAPALVIRDPEVDAEGNYYASDDI